jgi:ribosomal protein L24
MFKYEFHPLAKSLPLMWGSDFDEFKEDIRKNGQIVPIGIYEGRILDGRNRYRACKELGINGKFEKVSPKDAKAYVTSINVHRRQLTREQRSEHLTLLLAQQESLQMTNSEVAKAAGVSESVVDREKRKKASNPPVLTPSSAKPSKNGQKDKKTTSVPEKQRVEKNVQDADGTAIPPNALAYWNRKPEASNVLNQISAARGQIKKLMPDDPMWASVNLNGVLADLNSAYNRFAAAIPAYVCPMCKGVKPDGCKCCKGKGVISKFVYSTLPDDVKPKIERPF